jgi:two-component system NtrC family sensor kinase
MKRIFQNQYYRSLGWNMLLTIIVVAFIHMTLVSGIMLYKFRTTYREKVYAHLREVVEKHKQSIDVFLNERLSNIQFLGRIFGFDKLSDDEFLTDTLTKLQQEHRSVFVDLGVVDESGSQLAYAGPFKLGRASYSNAEWFREAMESQHYISDVFLGLRGLPHFIVAIRETWNGKPWILRATIDFVAFNNMVENIQMGKTGFAFILNKIGTFQTKSRPILDITPSREPYMAFHSILAKDKSFKKVHIFNKTDSQGVKNIYATSPLKNGDWLLVFQQSEADAFDKLQSAITTIFIFILIGAIGVIIIAFMVSKRMVVYISRGEKEKQMMNKKIVETGKLATVGELAAGVAHEINNPVAIMVEEAGWIEDLLEEEDLKQAENLSEFKRALNQIKTQGRRCKEITHKLLSFARKTDSIIKDVDVNELIEEVVSLSVQRAKYSKVEIKTELNPEIPSLRLSQTELQQVFMNLINNAVDAMEKEGGILNISTFKARDHIAIEFEDTGPGIPEANLQRLFDPFFTTKPVGKGTGLGLSICYGIIQKLGGEIEVESEIGVGTSFHIRIPTRHQAAGE